MFQTLLSKSGGINGDHSHICGAAKASCHVTEQAKAPTLELEKWQQELVSILKMLIILALIIYHSGKMLYFYVLNFNFAVLLHFILC